jgi:hypothetical protein
MKRKVWVFALVAALAVLATAAVSYRRAADPFLGAWESTDVDGSQQYLWILYNVGGAYLELYYDDGASACGEICQQGPPAAGVTAGHRLDGWELSSDGLIVYCLGEGGASWLIGDAEWSDDVAYTYDPASDELIHIVYNSPCDGGDDVEVRWSRIGLGQVKQLFK